MDSTLKKRGNHSISFSEKKKKQKNPDLEEETKNLDVHENNFSSDSEEDEQQQEHTEEKEEDSDSEISDKEEIISDKEEDSSEESENEMEEQDEGDYSFGDDDDDEEEEEKEDAVKVTSKFSEGFDAYRSAFMKTMDTKVSDDALGPVLAANKTLIAKRLDEANESVAKNEAKKEKRKLREKGHVVLAELHNPKEKSLTKLATKGVVKLFNAVSKAQSVQSNFDVSKSKDAKAAKKESKMAFLKELQRSEQPKGLNTGIIGSRKVGQSACTNEGSGWAALRDDFMLTSSTLKDWDKIPGETTRDSFTKVPGNLDDDDDDGSSD